MASSNVRSFSTIFNSALNSLMMVAFAVPEGGAVVGAGLAVVLGIFDIVLGLSSDTAAPPPPPVTQKELDAAINSMDAEVKDAIWKDALNTYVSRVDTLHTGLNSNWNTILNLKITDPASYAILYSDYFDSSKTSTEGDTLNTYFACDLSTISPLTEVRGFRGAIEGITFAKLPAEIEAYHQTRTTALYCLIGSFLACYLKAAVLWHWGQILLQWWQYNRYLLDSAKSVQPLLKSAYPAVTFDSQGDPVAPSLDWRSFQKLFPYVKSLKDEVQHQIDYAFDDTQGLCVNMRKNWEALDTQLASYDHLSSPLVAGQGISMAQMKEAGAKAADRIGKWGEMLYQYGFCFKATNDPKSNPVPGAYQPPYDWQLVKEDIQDFENFKYPWCATLASVDFETYQVQKNDTFASIAAKQLEYQDASYGPLILAANRDKCSSDSDLKEGMILNLYSKVSLPYVTVDLNNQGN